MIEVIKYLLCTASGVCIGLYFARGQMEKRYIDGLNDGYEEAKEKYQGQGSCQKCNEREADILEDLNEGSDPSPEVVEIAAKASEAFEKYQGNDVDTTPEVEVDIPRQPKGFDYNGLSSRSRISASAKADEYVPAIITMDEFVRNETGYKQFSITYFSGDDILAGESDQVIDLETRNVTLGDEIMALLKAGPEAMGGESTVYIQNVREGVELDITWSPGKYSDEVQNQAG